MNYQSYFSIVTLMFGAGIEVPASYMQSKCFHIKIF